MDVIMSKVILRRHILVPDNDLEAVTQALVVHKELTLSEPGCIVFPSQSKFTSA